MSDTPKGREIKTLADFNALVKGIQQEPGYQSPEAFAVGIARLSRQRYPRTLDTYYPVVNLGENTATAAVLAKVLGYLSGNIVYEIEVDEAEEALAYHTPFLEDNQDHPNLKVLQVVAKLAAEIEEGFCNWKLGEAPKNLVATFIGDLSLPPSSVEDVYLRLHLLSQRKVKPNGLNLEGIFGLLNTVVWTDKGPFDPEGFERLRLELRSEGTELLVHGVDKFPRMTDYVIPSGVRIADANRVRLGAYLGEGTTVMQEGFVNFNAGAEGPNMVEGRISQGVFVGRNTDIGGGASIMGTLSGGGEIVITVGENCLLGANSGLGISLGNNCKVEAGLYLTAGTKVTMPDGGVVAAREISGCYGLTFIRHSVTGKVLALPTRERLELNPALHGN